MGGLILEPPMSRRRQHKCRHCGQLYQPDPRNVRRQRYCAQPACRQASKAASQARWRASPKGRGYFRGRANVLRVQAWRKAHPGYWRRRPKASQSPDAPSRDPPKRSCALQEDCPPQALVPLADTPDMVPGALYAFQLVLM